MSKFKLPVTHVVTVEDREIGETRVYELCTTTKAAWALKEQIKRALDGAAVVHSEHALEALIEDALGTYNEVEDLFERGLIFRDLDVTGPY